MCALSLPDATPFIFIIVFSCSSLFLFFIYRLVSQQETKVLRWHSVLSHKVTGSIWQEEEDTIKDTPVLFSSAEMSLA